jgi:3-deoxy-7-phosphoheptulonate synthase
VSAAAPTHGRGPWLILDLQPQAEVEGLLAALRSLSHEEPRQVEAGWARYLAAPLAAGGRRAGDAACDLAAWRARPGVRRAWLQEQDAVFAAHPWHAGEPAVELAGWQPGSGELLLIAGPCSVESRSQLDEVAAAAAAAGARWLRGGAWKPRSSPYGFQGLGQQGLELLREAADTHGLRVITEVLGIEELPQVAELGDVLQVGSRNAQNFPLLRRLGGCGKPVLLKRGFGCTLQELIYAAEHLMVGGNPRVLLCERGIRSFESATRFTFDINALPWLRSRVPLPLIADPSHGTGEAGLVAAVARAAVAAGADGLMFELHPEPARALSDGRQALPLEGFAGLVAELRAVAAAVGRRL